MNKFLGLPDSFTNRETGDFSKLIENYEPMRFNVHNQDDTAVIDIDGFIGRDPFMEFMTGEKSPNTVESLKEQLRSITADKIIVNINSPGGDFNTGLVIMDLLKASSAEVVTNLYGLSASAATVVWQGGDKRRISKNSFALLHRVMLGVLGFFNANSFLSMAEGLEPLDNRLIGIFEEQSNSSREEITELMDAGEGYGKFIDAETVLDMGFADEIFDPADEDDEDVDRMDETEKANNALLDRLTLRDALQNALKESKNEEIQEKPEKTAFNNEARLKLMQMKEETSNGLL